MIIYSTKNFLTSGHERHSSNTFTYFANLLLTLAQLQTFANRPTLLTTILIGTSSGAFVCGGRFAFKRLSTQSIALLLL